VVAALVLGSSVAGIDSTVVAVALPAIGRNLHAGLSGVGAENLCHLPGYSADRWLLGLRRHARAWDDL